MSNPDWRKVAAERFPTVKAVQAERRTGLPPSDGGPDTPFQVALRRAVLLEGDRRGARR